MESLKSTNVLERLSQEINRRTNVVRTFPHEASCLRLVQALAVEIHEEWAKGPRCLDMSVLPAGAGCAAHLAEADIDAENCPGHRVTAAGHP